MLKLRAVVIVGSLAVLVATLGFVHHIRGARFSAEVNLRAPLTLADCIAEVRGFGYGAADQFCHPRPGDAWYHIVVRNVGHRGAWVQLCTISVSDPSARVPPSLAFVDVPLWLTEPGLGARPYLDPGRSSSLDWYLPGSLSGLHPVVSASCYPIVYGARPV